LVHLIAHVKKIIQQYPPPYTLMCSGGIDSQVMLWAWTLAGVEFKALHVSYNGYNEFDSITLEQFASRYGIKYDTVNFDVIEFLETRLDQYANKYLCGSPQLCTYMAMSELVDSGTKIFAGNLIYLSGMLPINNTIYGLQRYSVLSGYSVVPFFLSTDVSVSSAAALFWNNTAKDEYLAIKNLSSMTDKQKGYLTKQTLYTLAGFPTISQNVNFTGFERVEAYYDTQINRVSAIEKLRYSIYPVKRTFDYLFRYKYYQRFQNHYRSAIEILINS